jgi:hypothetical protein
MLRIAAALGLLTIGCYGYPRGGRRVELAWRATRAVEDSPVGWNHIVMAQARVGLDIAFASESAR